MITMEDIEKRLSVKQADSMTNPDGTQPKENQQNVPDAKNNKARSPWVDAGLGAAGGGLLGSALGYLYGHKGKWLAYDALAGGITGGGLGYMIGSSNNKNTERKKIKNDLEEIKQRNEDEGQTVLSQTRKYDDSFKKSYEDQKRIHNARKELEQTTWGKFKDWWTGEAADPSSGKASRLAIDTAINEIERGPLNTPHNTARTIAKGSGPIMTLLNAIKRTSPAFLFRGRKKINLSAYSNENLRSAGLRYVPPEERTENDQRVLVPIDLTKNFSNTDYGNK